MDYIFTINNGFMLGIDRIINQPRWFGEDDSYSIVTITGWQVALGPLRFAWGYIDDVEIVIEEFKHED